MTKDVGDDFVFLRTEAKIEPLICRWHAWSHLVTPLQLALHAAYRLIPSMESFASSPAAHIAANSDPKMFGGPFMNLSLADVDNVKQLISTTNDGCADLIQLAKDMRHFDGMLQEKASGYSLDEFYSQLPVSLQGLVELVYDINHHPSVRIFEDLLYDSDLVARHQEILLHATPSNSRSFFMSTPRLSEENGISFNMRFSDERLDLLSSARTNPVRFQELAERFEISEENIEKFREFFEPAAGRDTKSGEGARYEADGVRMRYFGHACVLLQTKDISILFDPFVSTESGDDGRLTFNDLPEFIDHVVLTHCHQDHFCIEMLVQLRHRIGQIIVPDNNCGSVTDPSMRLALQELGFKNIVALKPFENVELLDGNLVSLPFTGEHADLNIHSKQAVALTLKERVFLFLVDSDARDVVLYKRLMARIGRVDVLFIGMECHGAPLNWLYEPLLGKAISRRNNESRRLSGADCARAWNTISEIKPSKVFVYAMGQEPWMKFIMGLQYEADSIQLVESNKLIAQCNEAGIVAERLYIEKQVHY